MCIAAASSEILFLSTPIARGVSALLSRSAETVSVRTLSVTATFRKESMFGLVRSSAPNFCTYSLSFIMLKVALVEIVLSL